ncbi:CPBP family intramembrane metalloprotease [Cyanobium sp. ATX 6A2]|nr:CPBP family intramembrane metalloprotease [Cyanobium sp. ATX 6A2]
MGASLKGPAGPRSRPAGGRIQAIASLPPLRLPPSTAAPPRWKQLLAVLSLLLCGLLWINGLLQSLERPSVGNALELRQRQLQVLAAPALPERLKPLLAGPDSLEQLTIQLEQSLAADPGPGSPDQLLQLALLQLRGQQPERSAPLLERLRAQVPPARHALVAMLESGPLPLAAQPPRIAALTDPWQEDLSPLTSQLLCQALEPGRPDCGDPHRQGRALARLLAVSWLPGLLLLLGLGLLLRPAWLLIRHRAMATPALVGPPLDLVDVTLLIAGGFVVLGELSVPLLLAPALRPLLAPLDATPVRQQGLQVLLLYLGLMVPPLLILAAQLRPLARQQPANGWLQWRWRPAGSASTAALGHVLMVLPLVAFSGWMVNRLLGDPGGSNPLLELVLTARDPVALLCFGFTAMVLAPLFEETLFRGVLLPALGSRWGGTAGVLVSALVFGLAHLSVGELLPLVVLGVGLGWLRLRSGRLGPCVLMHSLWNGFTFTNLLLLAM